MHPYATQQEAIYAIRRFNARLHIAPAPYEIRISLRLGPGAPARLRGATKTANGDRMDEAAPRRRGTATLNNPGA
jgi:hypothetical protein